MINEVVATVEAAPLGRASNPKPFRSGYRAIMHYDMQTEDKLHAVEVYPDVEAVYPGDRVSARIRFLHPEYHVGIASCGNTFELRDGENVRARGVIEACLGAQESKGSDLLDE